MVLGPKIASSAVRSSPPAASRTTVQLPSGSLSRIARPVDLRGDSLGQPIAVQAGSFEFALNFFAPASFELE